MPCVTMSHLAKYRNRPSPPFPANDPACQGTTKKGNDGLMYTSVPDRKGVFKWKHMTAASRQRSPPRSRAITKTPSRNKSRSPIRRRTAPRNIRYEPDPYSNNPVFLESSFMTTDRRPGGKWKRLKYSNLPNIGSRKVNFRWKAGDGGRSSYSYGYRLNQTNAYVKKGDEDFAWGAGEDPVYWRSR